MIKDILSRSKADQFVERFDSGGWTPVSSVQRLETNIESFADIQSKKSRAEKKRKVRETLPTCNASNLRTATSKLPDDQSRIFLIASFPKLAHSTVICN